MSAETKLEAIQRMETIVDRAESVYNEKKDAAAEAKKYLDARILELRAMIRSTEQEEFDFRQEAPVTGEAEVIEEHRQLPAHEEPHGVTVVDENGSAEQLGKDEEAKTPGNVLTLPENPPAEKKHRKLGGARG